MAVLQALDYIVIIAMIMVSVGIGIFFACFGSKQRTSYEYFKGNRELSVLPVSASIVASSMSAIAYLGTPAEIYMYGPYYGLTAFMKPLITLIVTFCFLPVFYRLNLTSIFEYLELRFKNSIRYIIVALELCASFIYMGIVVYTPALALSTVTGISLATSIITVGTTCTFYTTIGGLKAVVWTDVFQAIIMVSGMLLMIIAGTVAYGGPAEGWKRAKEGQRGNLVNFDTDLTVVYSFWSITFGSVLTFTAFTSTSQLVIQRFNSCKTETQARLAGWLGICGIGLLQIIAVATGMTVFAYYAHCDPITSGHIERSDQIVPYFIIEVFRGTPGAPGFLIAGAFAASLSSVSSLVNGLAAVIGEDYMKSIFKNMSDRKYTYLVKGISLLLGGFAMVIAFLATTFGGVLQAAISYGSILKGPIFGVFCLGLFFPRANTIGSTVGLLTGLGMGFLLKIGSGFYHVKHVKPPLMACPVPEIVSNITTSVVDYHGMVTTSSLTGTIDDISSLQLSFFGMSYLYYALVTSFSTIIIGYVFSILTKQWEAYNTDATLYSPIVAYYPKRLLPFTLDFQKFISKTESISIKDRKEFLKLDYKNDEKEV